MTGDRDPFDAPSPAGPLGAAMARLTEDAPPAGFSEAMIRGEVDHTRAVRRQVFGGLAAAAAAITVLVVVVSSLGGGGSDTATSASMSMSASSTSAAAGAAPSLSSASAAATSSALSTSAAAGNAETRPAPAGSPSSAPDGAGGSPEDASAEAAACRPAPLDQAQLQAVESVITGLTRLDDCATSDGQRGVQRFAVAGGSVLVERRTGGYDPCGDGTVCTDVPGRPGLLAAVVDGTTRVWTGGRDGAVVLTADPAGTVSIDTLAAAAEALVSAGG